MKLLIMLVGIFVLIADIVISQSGSRFPIDATSMWRIDHIRNGVSDENTHVPGDDIYKYFVNGDTIVSTKTYYKIYKTGTAYLDDPFYYENLYAGALRDEENKLFFLKRNETEEVLLYNFNAKIDDTIQIPYEDVFVKKVVSSIDSLPDGRKLIHFNPKEPIVGCGDQFIIEGIGGSGGLLEGPACGHFWTFDYHLVCYIQNELLAYHNNNFEFNCEIINNQNIDKSIDTTGVWRIDKQTETDSISNFEKFVYFFCGDTIIESDHYLKLCKTGFQLHIETNGLFTSGYNDSVYIGALREVNKALYYIDKDNPEEELLYNFNLQVGDIVNGILYHQDTVKAIDTILDNRKVFYLTDNYWGNKIIEGIGSERGLLESKTENSYLICYMKGNVALYHDNSGAECMLSFDDFKFNECDKLKILPKNPTVNDEIKLVSRTCYEVSSEYPSIPVLSNKAYLNNGYNINLEIFYDYDKQSNSGTTKILIPVFDTVALGTLNKGNYLIDLAVHTIYHNNQIIDTAFSEKINYYYFTVSQSNNGIIDKTSNKNFKIYPVPSSDYIIIENLDVNTCINSIEVFNILGTKVAAIIVEDQSRFINKIDVSRLKKGIYLVTINSDNCSITNKIIIQ